MTRVAVACLVGCLAAGVSSAELPPGFVDLAVEAPTIRIDVRYAGTENFLGRPVDGYQRPRVILTVPAARALARAQAALAPFGLGLLVYDGYRPQRAVDHFVRWGRDLADQATKPEYYPEVDKARLFAEGYIAERSGHSRGSTVDLTMVDLGTGEPLDMGGPWDFFDPRSWPQSSAVPAAARAHRLLLRTVLVAEGFRPYEQEWWHFTLENEPFPTDYFDFPID
ncbi:MAG: M15 family metallopeptidase [Thermoanaerobaculia bacterium]|nr:M15 family metallopeptidase [Thermoanaerobaculia bacterium]